MQYKYYPHFIEETYIHPMYKMFEITLNLELQCERHTDDVIFCSRVNMRIFGKWATHLLKLWPV